MTDLKTIDAFILAHGITHRSVKLIGRTDADPSDWDRNASHYQVAIYRVGRTDPLIVSYSMGSAHKGAPKLSDVLDSLASDARSADESRDFAEFADALGYDADSLSGHRVYLACKESAGRIRRFFGATYRDLIACEPL